MDKNCQHKEPDGMGNTVFRSSVVPVFVVGLFFGVYILILAAIAWNFRNSYHVYPLNWIPGAILLTSYSLVRLFHKPLGFVKFRQRLFVTMLLYSILFVLIAFPFWFASFFMPLLDNSFVHCFIMILLIELWFDA
ncbi:MAG: hypothetical protein EOO45_03965 [Flavobacterium sp.]|nr:MAG: hypothetical protein EOO45_03965 [Flavobacterium sp.]